MTLIAPRGVSLRPYLPRDVPGLAGVFRDAIEELAAEDYDPDQRAAWSAAGDDEAAFAVRLEPLVTLLAEVENQIAGFVTLKDNDTVELLYVSPRFARRGIATFLCGAVERLAQARKATLLSVKASDTARPLFERLGYIAVQRNMVSLHGTWLANTTMQKILAAIESGAN